MPSKKESQPTAAAAAAIPIERAKFRSLILTNPNYFGTLKDSVLKPIKPMVGNVTYEELKCVGYNPDANLLKGVVWVKLNSGFSGGICTAGSREYVRFYLSFDNGATWQDQGSVSFASYDVPGPKPLEYAVTLQPQRHSTWCFRESLPKVRAILSWNYEPPANTPDFPPVWGNVVEAHVQIHPIRLFYVGDLLKEAKITLPKEIESLIDPKAQIPVATPTAASAASLLAAYKDKGVKEHRTLFPDVHKYLAAPAAVTSLAAAGGAGSLAQFGVDIGAVVAAIEATAGDTGFEELMCVGLDPNGTENLVGAVKIKRPLGYSGTQCQAGSQEYVAFWVDWQDGAGWHWVGTTQVNVHDFATLPPDGLVYAVSQPINLATHCKPCQDGPVTAKVRAILSWSVKPVPSNPDYKPTWGNRVETLVHVYPGISVKTGDYTPYLEGVCGANLCDIDPATGFAPGDAPFGGSVNIIGFIPGAPSVTTPAANRLRYKCSVRQVGTTPWQPLNDSFGVTIEEQIGGGMPTYTSATQSVDANGYYTYQAAPNVPGAGWRQIFPPDLLTVWNTGGKTDRWEIKVEALDPVTHITYEAGTVLCMPGSTSHQNVIIALDNVAPLASLFITGFSRGGGPVQVATDCATFQVGDVISGTYSVTDEHFGSLALVVEPSGHTHGAAVNPSSRSYPTVPTTGESGNWTLDTAGMDPCGYTIQLQSNDRTIVSCDGPWRNDGNFVGFCLVAVPKK